MKLLLTIPLVIIMMAFQSDSHEWNQINRAISQGNANALSSWFAPTVTLNLPAHKGSFSSTQARSIMNGFFKNNPVQAFTLSSSGNSGQAGRFYLGTYTSKHKRTFSVYVLLNPIENKSRITRLTFESN